MDRQRDEYGNPNEITPITLNGSPVTSVSKNSQGDIEAFVLENGQRVPYEEAISAVANGNSQGLLVQKGNQGQQVIRSYPDAHKENNLDNLPSIT